MVEGHETDRKACLRRSKVLKILRGVALATDSIPVWPLSDEPLRQQRHPFGVPSKGFDDKVVEHGVTADFPVAVLDRKRHPVRCKHYSAN